MRIPAIRMGVEGLFKLEAVKPDGTRRLLADWFLNTISNAGLNRMGTSSSYLERAFVGSGTAPPDDVTFTETALTNPRVSANAMTTTTGNVYVSAVPEWYSYKRLVYRIAPQLVAYNASEVAVGDFIATGPPMTYNLFSRQLILDGLGSPTTISVLADEYLDITYELRNYPVLDDVVFTVDITGTTPVTHDCVLRPSDVDNATRWALGLGSVMAHQTSFPGDDPSWFSATAVLGAVTSAPTGSAVGGSDSISNAAYVNNSYQRDFTFTAGLTKGNASGGIGAVVFSPSVGQFQVSFDPPIAKNSTKILSLTCRIIWARRVLDPSEL